jgi:hypothetical protein
MNNETEVELPSNAAGIYFIRVYDKKGEYKTQKIIVN